MKANRKGFSSVEGLLILVVVGLVSLVGWYVLNSRTQTAPKVADGISTTQSSQTKVPKSCPEDNTPSDQSFLFIPWLNVTKTTVDLCKWNISITLPADQVNKAVYKYHASNFSGTYYFSTHNVIDDEKCLNYYGSDELRFDYAGTYEVTRYQGTDNGAGALPKGTLLQDYYLTHKAADGNYMLIAQGKFYKVNGYFFGVYAENPEDVDKYATARTANCVNEKPNFQSVFSDAFSTLKSN